MRLLQFCNHVMAIVAITDLMIVTKTTYCLLSLVCANAILGSQASNWGKSNNVKELL
jgi:hypothetical protein